MELMWLDKDGWPVEHIIGRPILNWFRDKIHRRSQITKKDWETKQRVWHMTHDLHNLTNGSGQFNENK
jgi:hypothetical protein